MASKKSTRVATPIFGSTTVDDLKVADIYEGDASSTASYNKYKTIANTTVDNIISGVKKRKLTDITSVIKPGADGLSIDKAAATRRIEQVAGMKMDPNSIAQKAAEAAITGPQDVIAPMVSAFVSRRNYMVNESTPYRGCPA